MPNYAPVCAEDLVLKLTPVPAKELSVGDRFLEDGKIFELTTVLIEVGQCDSGDRVYLGKRWYAVTEYADNVVLYELSGNKPGGDYDPKTQKTNNFPHPNTVVQKLTPKEVNLTP